MNCNEILACPGEDGWGSKTVAQSHTTLTSPVALRVKISVLEEEAALLTIPQCKIHCYYTDHIDHNTLITHNKLFLYFTLSGSHKY